MNTYQRMVLVVAGILLGTLFLAPPWRMLWGEHFGGDMGHAVVFFIPRGRSGAPGAPIIDLPRLFSQSLGIISFAAAGFFMLADRKSDSGSP